MKVWGGKRRSPISEFTAHDGDAVTSIAFLSNQENTFLLTAVSRNADVLSNLVVFMSGLSCLQISFGNSAGMHRYQIVWSV